MTMDELKPGESAYIETVGGSGALRHHLLDMGLTPDAEITLQKVAPMGDPVQFEVRGYELTLRLEEARKVTVKNVHKKDSPLKAAGSRRNDYPFKCRRQTNVAICGGSLFTVIFTHR